MRIRFNEPCRNEMVSTPQKIRVSIMDQVAHINFNYKLLANEDIAGKPKPATAIQK